MSTPALKVELEGLEPRCALEKGLPIHELSQVAEQESWRKEINRPLYHIHKWWATRLGTIFRGLVLGALGSAEFDIWKEFYKRQDFNGRIVLDPFMGSGTTLGEALKVGASAIGCDINPISAFSVRQSFTAVPERDLYEAFKTLERDVAHEIRRYYSTKDPVTGDEIPVLYCFWVKVLKTPEGEEIPLFSRYVFSQDAYPKKKPRAQILCPFCWKISEGKYDQTELLCPHCSKCFNPQEGPAQGQQLVDGHGVKHKIKGLLPKDRPPDHRLYALLALRPNGEKIYLHPTDHDRALFAEASSRLQSEDLPLPTLEVRPGNNTDQARGYNYLRWRDFFNDRQLLCLGILLRSILKLEDQQVREQLLCLFSSTLEFNNLFCSFKGEGTGAVRHMFSNHILKPERTPLENCIWGTEKSSGTFSTLFESRLLRAKKYLDEPFEIAFEHDLFGEKTGSSKVIASNPIRAKLVDDWKSLKQSRQGLLVLNGDSSHLPIPDKCVDAVVTDPPYFDFVHYSELSDFFFAWLSPVLRGDHKGFCQDNSSAAGEVQQKDPENFGRLLGGVFKECRRVLKDEGVLTFSFHHSRAEGWAAIHQALQMAGLRVVATHPVHAELRAANPKSAAIDPISIDAILICRKFERVGTTSFYDQSTTLERTVTNAEALAQSGMRISKSDVFVMGAAQTLVGSASEVLAFKEITERIESIRIAVQHRDPLARYGDSVSPLFKKEALLA